MSENSAPIREQLGQMLVVGFEGTKCTDPAVLKLAGQIEAGLVGGIILFRRNIENPEQIKNLLGFFRSIKTKYPLFIMLDQEGGKVQRLCSANGFPDFKSAKYVAESMSIDEAREHYRAMAIELREVGFNFNMAPCVDLDCTPPCSAIGQYERSYSFDYEKVIEYARVMIEAFKAEGVQCCLKHFPGHGRAQGDTHTGLVDITNTWTEEELIPFQTLLADASANAVMTAHLAHQAVDPDVPTTFSKKWLDKIRNQNFPNTLILTDDLHMGAIIQRYSLKEIVTLSIKAGCDLLLFSNNPLASKSAGIRHDLRSGDSTKAGEMIVPDVELVEKVMGVVQDRQDAEEKSCIQASFSRIINFKLLI